MNNEIWKDLKDYEGLYQVSNFGRIRNISRLVNDNGGLNIIKQKILKPSKDSSGYLQIVLTKNKIRKSYKVHRLIALTFIPNPKNFLQINHKNENKLDNRAENLEWCTHKYNCNYGTRNYRCTKHCYHKINQYDNNFNFIKTYNSLKEAELETGIKYQCISACCRKIINQSGGYIWRYLNE